MKTTPVLILAGAAAAVVIVAVLVSRKDRVASPDASTAERPRMFDGLAPKLADVAVIDLKHGDKEFTVRKTADGWEIPERGGFPAKSEDVKKVLFKLGELRKGEERTQKPDLYPQLNVQDPDGKPLKEGEAGPTLLTLKDSKGQTLASAIVGNTKLGAKPGVFIRKAGEAQSWLGEGTLEVPSEAIRWMDATLINVPRDRIKGATATQPDGSTVRVSRAKPEDASFTVADIPAGKELKYAAAGDPLATAIAGLNFDDVTAADQIDFEGKKGGKPAGYCEFRTFDGLMVAVQLAEQDGKTWAKLSAYSEATPKAAPEKPAESTPAEAKPGEAKPGETKPGETKPAEAKPPEATPSAAKPGEKSPADVQKEVNEINTRTSKWAFAIPSWKLTAFETKMSDLIKSDEPPKPPPSLEGTTPIVPTLPK